ncbi:MAG: hypothetical protein ACLQVL_12830 [Terriglobia bacterium]
MENIPGISQSRGFWHWLIRRWLAMTGRKVRMLQAADVASEGPALFAVSHPAGFLQALILTTAIERPVHCLLPSTLARGLLARFLARHLDIILYEGESPDSEATRLEVIDILTSGGALLVFADQSAVGLAAPGELASTAARVVSLARAQHLRRRFSVHPVHLFLPEPAARSCEILIYVDSVVSRPEGQAAASSRDAETRAFVAELESRFRENAFQLRPADLEYFFADLEEVLQTGLQEDWASHSDWKQDTEGFVLSRLVTEWVKQTNYLRPGRLVTLRTSLEEYRRLQRQCALRELEVDHAGSPLHSGWRRSIVWIETLLGLPVALYGLLNHLAIGLVLFLAGSFKKENDRARRTEWTIRIAVTLGLYAAQIFLVAHRLGRAAAGYYAPSLPVSGAYLLWRYVAMVRPQARLLFIALTIPALKRKIRRLQHALLEELDQLLTSYEERTAVAR